MKRPLPIHIVFTMSGMHTLQTVFFKLTEKQKLLAEWYAANLELFLYGSQCGGVSAWVSEDVLKYRNLVEKYAEKYGISNFTDVINAVMMAESGGRSADVMQASECPITRNIRRNRMALQMQNIP